MALRKFPVEPKEWRPRINFDVSEEFFLRQQKLVPWGVRNAVLVSMYEMLVDAIEREGQIVAYLIMNKSLNIFEGMKEDGLKRVSEPHRAQIRIGDVGRGTPGAPSPYAAVAASKQDKRQEDERET